MNSYNLFVQAGATHTAHSFTQPNNPALAPGPIISTTLVRYENPAYTEYDASIGCGKDAWSVEAYAQNLTNVITSTFTSSAQFAVQQTITRPRVIGARISYRF